MARLDGTSYVWCHRKFTTMSAAPNVLIVGDFPPQYGGVAVHVEVLQRAVRSRGGECTVLDIGKGQLPGDGVVPAGGYASFTARLVGHALRGYRIRSEERRVGKECRS